MSRRRTVRPQDKKGSDPISGRVRPQDQKGSDPISGRAPDETGSDPISGQRRTYWDAPPERLAVIRILVGLFAVGWVWLQLGTLDALANLPAKQFSPQGIVKLLDAPLAPWLVAAIAVATIALMAAFVVGIAYRVVAPIAAIALLWTLCYRNSWGSPLHTENLLVLHVLVLAVAPAANAYAYRSYAKPSAIGYGWAIRLLAALTVATYLLAGIAKLRITGFDWIDGEVLRNQIAIDNARKLLLGDSPAWLATLFLEHPGALTGFSALSLAIEVGAPLALLRDRVGKLWAAAAWGFHVGVVLLMNIWFLYPLVGLAFLPFFRVERPIVWWRESRRRRAG
jgi:hypothetical protein